MFCLDVMLKLRTPVRGSSYWRCDGLENRGGEAGGMANVRFLPTMLYRFDRSVKTSPTSHDIAHRGYAHATNASIAGLDPAFLGNFTRPVIVLMATTAVQHICTIQVAKQVIRKVHTNVS